MRIDTPYLPADWGRCRCPSGMGGAGAVRMFPAQFREVLLKESIAKVEKLVQADKYH